VTLARELEKRGLSVERQVAVAIEFEGEKFEVGFRADLIVGGEGDYRVEVFGKAESSSKKQLLTYLRLTGMRLGYLLNFGETLMKDGITRTINGQIESDLRDSVAL
jgi:GxxExxY protein